MDKDFIPPRNDVTWESFKLYLQQELMTTYQILARLETSQEQTEQARGRAAFITKLLFLDSRQSLETAEEQDL